MFRETIGCELPQSPAGSEFVSSRELPSKNQGDEDVVGGELGLVAFGMEESQSAETLVPREPSQTNRAPAPTNRRPSSDQRGGTGMNRRRRPEGGASHGQDHHAADVRNGEATQRALWAVYRDLREQAGLKPPRARFDRDPRAFPLPSRPPALHNRSRVTSGSFIRRGRNGRRWTLRDSFEPSLSGSRPFLGPKSTGIVRTTWWCDVCSTGVDGRILLFSATAMVGVRPAGGRAGDGHRDLRPHR